MASWRDLLSAAGVSLEAAALAALADDMGALALAAHVGACAAIAVGLGRRLPAGPAAARLAFAMALFLPVFGVIGWLAAALVRPAGIGRRGGALVRTPIPGPEAVRSRTDRLVAARAAGPVGARVAAARDRRDPPAIALLRRALAHPDDDARLVAHALLETRLRAAHRRLHAAARELESAPVDGRAAIHRRLAAEHWELARLGLAEGECLNHALDRARHHARAALADDPTPAPLWLLLGRIALLSHGAAEAEAALAAALERGLPPSVAEPYLLEASFAAGHFDRVRQRLACSTGGEPALDRIRRYWS